MFAPSFAPTPALFTPFSTPQAQKRQRFNCDPPCRSPPKTDAARLYRLERLRALADEERREREVEKERDSQKGVRAVGESEQRGDDQTLGRPNKDDIETEKETKAESGDKNDTQPTADAETPNSTLTRKRKKSVSFHSDVIVLPAPPIPASTHRDSKNLWRTARSKVLGWLAIKKAGSLPVEEGEEKEQNDQEEEVETKAILVLPLAD